MRLLTQEPSQQLQRSTQEAHPLSQPLKPAQHPAQLHPLTGMLHPRGLEPPLPSFLEDAGSMPRGLLLPPHLHPFQLLHDPYRPLLGDKVLPSVAPVICESIKGRDIAARIGGEEFAIFLPDTTVEGGTILAKRICTATSARTIRRTGTDRSMDRVTISIGVAASTDSDTLETLLDRADKAMYAGKQAGRNRVSQYESA